MHEEVECAAAGEPGVAGESGGDEVITDEAEGIVSESGCAE